MLFLCGRVDFYISHTLVTYSQRTMRIYMDREGANTMALYKGLALHSSYFLNAAPFTLAVIMHSEDKPTGGGSPGV